MKKIFLALALIACSTWNIGATGTLVANQSQSGVLTSTNSGITSVTNFFLTSYTYPPAMTVFLVSSVTNTLPITNTVTTTNFVLTFNSATNPAFAWTAQPVSTRVQYGTITSGPNNGATTYTNAFSPAFVSAPTVICDGSSGATNGVVVSSVSASQVIFSYGSVTNQTIYWMAIGPAYSRAQTGPNGTDGVITY